MCFDYVLPVDMYFYRIYDDSHGKQFAFASGYGPVDDLSFLKPEFLDNKRASWNINGKRPGISIDSGGRIWPDVLGCGCPPPSFFASQRVIDSLSRIGASFG